MNENRPYQHDTNPSPAPHKPETSTEPQTQASVETGKLALDVATKVEQGQPLDLEDVRALFTPSLKSTHFHAYPTINGVWAEEITSSRSWQTERDAFQRIKEARSKVIFDVSDANPFWKLLKSLHCPRGVIDAIRETRLTNAVAAKLREIPQEDYTSVVIDVFRINPNSFTEQLASLSRESSPLERIILREQEQQVRQEVQDIIRKRVEKDRIGVLRAFCSTTVVQDNPNAYNDVLLPLIDHSDEDARVAFLEAIQAHPETYIDQIKKIVSTDKSERVRLSAMRVISNYPSLYPQFIDQIHEQAARKVAAGITATSVARLLMERHADLFIHEFQEIAGGASGEPSAWAKEVIKKHPTIFSSGLLNRIRQRLSS